MERPILTFAKQYNLTRRETEVLSAIATHGFSNEDTAKSVWIKRSTLTLHMTKILQKTNTESTRALLSKIINFLLEEAQPQNLERGDNQENETCR